MAADIEALQQALIGAIQSGGELAAINHIVTYSPLFNPRDLPAELRHGNHIRYLPPANLLGIPGLEYEFAHNTPDHERFATSQVVSTIIYQAFAMRLMILADPALHDQYGEACLRIGDMTAD